MKRRTFLEGASLAAASVMAGAAWRPAAAAVNKHTGNKPVLTVAHITDVHIMPQNNAPLYFKKCIDAIARHKVDFFLNGGDSIMAADYNDITRERVLELWQTWDNCRNYFRQYEMYSCIGNHDTWWAAPSREDEMYGKPYVVKRLGIPNRYYSVAKGGWHFIMLDGNNEKISLDEEQYNWLEKELAQLPANTPVLLMSHYPILGVTPFWAGGMHSDYKKLKTLFYRHRDKIKVCLSGHNHLQDSAVYNGVHYCCNGAVSGFWWGKGDEKSAAPYYYEETAPGYAILQLYADGRVENRYYTYSFE